MIGAQWPRFTELMVLAIPNKTQYAFLTETDFEVLIEAATLHLDLPSAAVPCHSHLPRLPLYTFTAAPNAFIQDRI